MNLRQQNIEKLKTDEYDVLIISNGHRVLTAGISFSSPEIT